MNAVAIEYFKTIDESQIKIHRELQLDFFKTVEESEVEQLVRQMTETRFSLNKIRKALFARDNEKDRRITELEERLAIIERGICYGK